MRGRNFQKAGKEDLLQYFKIVYMDGKSKKKEERNQYIHNAIHYNRRSSRAAIGSLDKDGLDVVDLVLMMLLIVVVS